MGADQSVVEKNSDTLNELANEFVIKINFILFCFILFYSSFPICSF